MHKTCFVITMVIWALGYGVVLSHLSHKWRASRLGINSCVQPSTDPALHWWDRTGRSSQPATYCLQLKLDADRSSIIRCNPWSCNLYQTSSLAPVFTWKNSKKLCTVFTYHTRQQHSSHCIPTGYELPCENITECQNKQFWYRHPDRLPNPCCMCCLTALVWFKMILFYLLPKLSYPIAIYRRFQEISTFGG